MTSFEVEASKAACAPGLPGRLSATSVASQGGLLPAEASAAYRDWASGWWDDRKSVTSSRF